MKLIGIIPALFFAHHDESSQCIYYPAASQMVSYGALKLLPFWDPLRGDPRFEAIVQRFAPTAMRFISLISRSHGTLLTFLFTSRPH